MYVYAWEVGFSTLHLWIGIILVQGFIPRDLSVEDIEPSEDQGAAKDGGERDEVAGDEHVSHSDGGYGEHHADRGKDRVDERDDAHEGRVVHNAHGRDGEDIRQGAQVRPGKDLQAGPVQEREGHPQEEQGDAPDGTRDRVGKQDRRLRGCGILFIKDLVEAVGGRADHGDQDPERAVRLRVAAGGILRVCEGHDAHAEDAQADGGDLGGHDAVFQHEDRKEVGKEAAGVVDGGQVGHAGQVHREIPQVGGHGQEHRAQEEHRQRRERGGVAQGAQGRAQFLPALLVRI